MYESRPPRQCATTPRAIHFGFRRPGIRGGCGVAANPAAEVACCFRTLRDDRVVRGSVSMVMVWSLNAGGIAWSSGGSRRDDIDAGLTSSADGADADD